MNSASNVNSSIVIGSTVVKLDRAGFAGYDFGKVTSRTVDTVTVDWGHSRIDSTLPAYLVR